jgi:hypothetical protein
MLLRQNTRIFGFTILVLFFGAVLGTAQTSTHIDFLYPDRTSFLNDGWTFVGSTASGAARNTEQTGSLAISYDQTGHPGTIRIPVGSGELWEDANSSQNMLLRSLPVGWTSVRLYVAAFAPRARDQETGLIAYQDDDNYVIVNRIFGSTGSVIETFSETGQMTTSPQKVSLINSGGLILRMDRNGSAYTGMFSVNGGSSWAQLTTITNNLTNPKLAIQVGGDSSGTTPNADLGWIEVITPSAPTASPTVTSLSPNSGTQGQSLSITINGTNFQSGATCSFGTGVTVTSCIVNSASQLTAAITISTSAASGSRTLTITNPNGQSASLSNAFTVIAVTAPPTVTSLSPNSGTQGQSLSITINGTNFQSGATCSFGTGVTVTSCTFSSSSRLIAAAVIAGSAISGSRNVTISNPSGLSGTLTNGFSVQNIFTAHLNFDYPDRAALLNAGWSYIAKTASSVARNTEQSGSLAPSYDQSAHPGAIRIALGSGELWQDSNDSQDMLIQVLPANWTSIRLDIQSFNPVARDQETGIIAYQDDDNYVVVNRLFGTAGSVIEMFSERAQVTTPAFVKPITNTGNLILRLDKNLNSYAGYYSTNGGGTWTQLGTLSNALTNPNLAIQAGGNSGGSSITTDLAWVEILQPSSATGPAVTLSTTNLTFGAQAVGIASSQQSVTLTNSGNDSLSISGISSSGDYSQTNNCPASIGPGGRCAIAITFTPSTTGSRPGSITISDNAPNASQTITLSGTGKSLSNIVVNPTNPTVTLGNTLPFSAIGTFSDGSTQDLTTSATWGSANSSVATISNSPGSQGLATGSATGNSLIQATQGPIVGSTILNVGPTVLSVSPQIISLTTSQTQQFRASSSPVTWMVDGVAGGSSEVGTISSEGLYTAPANAGTHTISAIYNSQTVFVSAIVQNYSGVFTWHFDNALTGQNLDESALTPTNVNAAHFGLAFTDDVDGYVYAQPLYVANVQVPGVGVRNVVYVATEHDSVFAFDADKQGSALWQVSFLQPASGVTTIPSADTNCTDLVPEIGITSTPVIDPSTNTLYVLARTKQNGQYFARLHALDLATGTEKFGGPTTISGLALQTGGGTVSFDPLLSNQRTGLLLNGSNIYIGFASQCDNGPYHGWLFAYNAQTLQQSAGFSTTPDGAEGGLWMAGASASADSSGNVFIISGNGTFDANSGGHDYGDSFIRLNSNLGVTGFFTPFNQDSLSSSDWDLGSSGAMLLPDQPGPHPHVMVGAGKEKPARIYVVDRDNLGGYQSGSDSQIVQTIPGSFSNGLFSTAAYFNGNVYFAATNDVLKSYTMNNGLLSTTPSSQDSITLSFPGSTPIISANGNTLGIVWTLERNSATNSAILRAYDAMDISKILYDSRAAGVTTAAPVKFAVPIVANGKVYFGTQTKLVVFALH